MALYENETQESNEYWADVRKKNELIAVFMGGEYREVMWGDKKVTELFLPEAHITEGNKDLFYHESWNQLMQVVEKIETLKAYDGRGEVNYVVSIEVNQCIISQGGEGEIEYEQADTKIAATWEAVVKFIEWYNSENKTKGK